MSKIKRLWVTIVGLSAGVLLRAGAPCEVCQEEPLCLGACAYELLLKAEKPAERLQAQILLGKAWILGNFQQGAFSVLHEALSRAPDEEVALRMEACYWLGQAHHQLSPDSAAYYYRRVKDNPAAPSYWKAKAALGLSSLFSEKNPTRAQVYISEALEAGQAAQDAELQALALNQLAVVEAGFRQYAAAIRNAEQALKLARSTQKPRLLSAILTNLATLYDDMGKPREALPLYQEAVEIAPDSLSQAHALIGLATHYYRQDQTMEAEKILNRLQLSLSKLPFSLRQPYYQLRLYMALDRRALGETARFFEAALSDAQRALREVEASRTAQLEQLSGLRLREAQLKQLQLSRRRERLLYGMSAVFFLLLIAGIGYAYTTAQRRAREEATFRREIEQLSRQLKIQSEALERQNDELTRISEALSEALQELYESINAAERLQKALMPPLTKLFPGTAVHYQPLQQVGGDFYVVAADAFTGRFLIAVGDATGHGISGSILASIFGATLQNFFIQSPNQSARSLLQRVHAFAARLLSPQESSGRPMLEGADMVAVIVDTAQQTLNIALAGRPLWLWSPQEGLKELEGGRRGIDSMTPPDYEFPAHTLPLHPEAVLYLFTDGITDALNPQGRKWGARRLRELILQLTAQEPKAEEQMQAILQSIQEWRGEAQPNDDMTLLILPVRAILRRTKAQTLPTS